MSLTNPYTTAANSTGLVIPLGVNVINIQAFGGGGGGPASGSAVAGNGGVINTNFKVNSGDILNIYVGGGGTYGGYNTGNGVITSPLTGGGGGYSTQYGGGGGAMTCVTLTSGSTTSVLIIAGGGGGGDSTNGGNGGSGNSTSSGLPGGGTGGGAGGGVSGSGGLRGDITTQSGSSGANTASGLLSSFTAGNGGGNAITNAQGTSGGGGGGGFGGGGGGGTISGGGDGYGGGGGSSYVNANFISSSPFSPTYSTTYGSGGGASTPYGQVGGVNISWQASQPTPSSGPSSGPSANNDLYCFLKGTRILTETGYRMVEDLRKGEKVITKKGLTEITEMVSFKSTQKKHPLYVLPKDTLAPGVPQEHLYMSNNHAFKHNGLWHHMKCSTLTKRVKLEEMEYYHILVEDYFASTIVAENVEVETCFRYKEDNVMLAWSCNSVCCQPLRVVKELGQVRAEKIKLPLEDLVTDSKLAAPSSKLAAPSSTLAPSKLAPSKLALENLAESGKLYSVKLNQTNIKGIEKHMSQSFDPQKDTYQLKKGINIPHQKQQQQQPIGMRRVQTKQNPQNNIILQQKVQELLARK